MCEKAFDGYIMTNSFHEGYVAARDGTEIYYNEQGTGPAIILCSGISVSFVYWKYLTKALRRNYRVVQWNYRGHGRSGAPRDYGHTTIAHLADDLERLRSHLGIRTCVLLGYSAGVQVILEYYRRHPQRAVALIAALGSYERPFDNVFRVPLAEQLLNAMNVVARHASPAMELLWRFIYTNPFRVNYHLTRLVGIIHWTKCSWEDFAPFFDHFRELDVRSYFEIANAAQNHSAKDVLGRIAVPTLVIGGGKDVLTPAKRTRRMAAMIPDCQYLEIPDGAHASTLEEPELINERILEFLRTATPSRPARTKPRPRR